MPLLDADLGPCTLRHCTTYTRLITFSKTLCLKKYAYFILHVYRFIFLQTQSCNWRSPKSNQKRTRRETMELSDQDLQVLNRTLSESVNLFQAIHVLQSKEDELAFRNVTNAGKSLHLLPDIKCLMRKF